MHLHVPGAGPAGCAGFTAPAPPAAVLQPAALRPHCRMAAPALLPRSGLIKAVNGRQDSLSFVLGHEVRRFRHRRRLLCRPCGRACCLCLLSPRASAHACRLPRCLQVGHAIGRHRCVCGGLGQLTGRALQGMPCPSRRRLPATCPHTLCVQPGEGRADVQRHVCGRCVGGRGRAPAQGEARPLPRSAAGRVCVAGLACRRCWPAVFLCSARRREGRVTLGLRGASRPWTACCRRVEGTPPGCRGRHRLGHQAVLRSSA